MLYKIRRKSDGLFRNKARYCGAPFGKTGTAFSRNGLAGVLYGIRREDMHHYEVIPLETIEHPPAALEAYLPAARLLKGAR